jgi:superfamily II DNA or RNA helicase
MSVDVEARIAAPPDWNIGDPVVVRSTRCTILRTERFADCKGLQLAPCAPPDAPFGTLLVPFDRPRRVVVAASRRAVRPRRWLHALRAAAANQHPFGGLRCAARARIELFPYQLEPALAVHRHAALRVLIADAVGLGKTIQAGLVLAEVLDLDSARRALIAVPAGLRAQWQSELHVHFEIAARVCDTPWLRERTRELPPDANPWALPGTYIVSLDLMKRPEVLKSIEELLWDIVIIDEAHSVTVGTERRAAVDAVAARARRVVLLTATPHSGDEAQFDALLRIGEGSRRTPLVMFRRTRADVGSGTMRRSSLLRVRPSQAERRMHELLNGYASRVWRESHARGDRRARLMAIVLRKRALSSAGSLAASLARRIDLLSSTASAGAVQLQLPLSQQEDEAADRVADEVLGVPGLTDPAIERRWLGALLEAARRAARNETKVARLCRILTRTSEPAIVFTEYRDTLGRLERALKISRHPVLTLHGGMTPAERRNVQCTFNDSPALLLATDAAAEGLNLHQQCRLVIHFELPWNPLRLEQRAGRVDRIGQKALVHEIALVADGTAERVVLAPLAKRVRRARDFGVGGGRMLELLSESAVANAVMAGDVDSLGPPLVSIASSAPQLAAEGAHEASRLADTRRWVTSSRMPADGNRPVVSVLTRRDFRTGPTVTLVYSLTLVTSDARMVHSEPLVLRIAGEAIDAIGGHSRALAAVEEVIRIAQPAIDTVFSSRFEALSREVVPKHAQLLASLREREIAISGDRLSTARQLVQPGLFDRRALRDAEARHSIRSERTADAGEVLSALARAETVSPAMKLEAALIRLGTRR